MKLVVISYIFGFFVAFYTAFVATVLWGYYITPFYPLVCPSIPHLAGLSYLIKLFTEHFTPVKDGEDMAQVFIYNVILPTTCLIMGWVIHFFL